MDINEYKDAVIRIFKSGEATESQWQQLAEIVLYASENDFLSCEAIDRFVFGDCKSCGKILYDGECTCGPVAS